jgi:hypothetical protein
VKSCHYKLTKPSAAHVHIQGGKIVEAAIEQRPCPARLTVFSPVDHSLRKAVVIPAPGIPHNHPFCPSDKRTRRAKAAVRAVGAMDQTSRNVDRSAYAQPVRTMFFADTSHKVTHSPTVVDGCSNSIDMVVADSSVPTSLSRSSISVASMAPGYRPEQFYS